MPIGPKLWALEKISEAERGYNIIHVKLCGMCVCPSVKQFGPIGMKLGIDTLWDPGSDMG